MRNPKVRNKYNLNPKDIKKIVVLDPERLHEVCWRNNVIQAWCLSENTAKSYIDVECGTYGSYWIGFYDDDAKAYTGKVRVYCHYPELIEYKFKSFYNYKEIDKESQLELQEMLLEKINWLIDERIVKISGK